MKSYSIYTTTDNKDEAIKSLSQFPNHKHGYIMEILYMQLFNYPVIPRTTNRYAILVEE